MRITSKKDMRVLWALPEVTVLTWNVDKTDSTHTRSVVVEEIIETERNR